MRHSTDLSLCLSHIRVLFLLFSVLSNTYTSNILKQVHDSNERWVDLYKFGAYEFRISANMTVEGRLELNNEAFETVGTLLLCLDNSVRFRFETSKKFVELETNSSSFRDKICRVYCDNYTPEDEERVGCSAKTKVLIEATVTRRRYRTMESSINKGSLADDVNVKDFRNLVRAIQEERATTGLLLGSNLYSHAVRGTSESIFGTCSDSAMARKKFKVHVENLNRQVFVDGYPERERKIVGVGGGTRVSGNIERAFEFWKFNRQIRGNNRVDVPLFKYSFRAIVGDVRDEAEVKFLFNNNDVFLEYGHGTRRMEKINVVEYAVKEDAELVLRCNSSFDIRVPCVYQSHVLWWLSVHVMHMKINVQCQNLQRCLDSEKKEDLRERLRRWERWIIHRVRLLKRKKKCITSRKCALKNDATKTGSWCFD